MKSVVLLVALALVSQVCLAVDWSAVDRVLQQGIKDEAYPGCVAAVADKTGILYMKSFGSFTYGVPPPFNNGQNPPMTIDTLFDMASCTKTLATTTAAALLYQWGFLDVEMRVSDPYLLGSEFAQNGKQDVLVRHLLLHNAGFIPDPVPNYNDARFGCPETSKYQPEENFSCRERIWDSLMKQSLARAPNVKYVYSDLSYMTLANVVGKLAYDHKLVDASTLLDGCLINPASPSSPPTPAAKYQCYFEAFVRTHVVAGQGLKSTSFLLPKSKWAQAAPAEIDTYYLNRTIQGQVSDGNAYAMGGIAGHAGLFSNVPDSVAMMMNWAYPSGFLTESTVKLWTAEYNHTQSSRAFGWNTNDPDASDSGWGLSCGTKLSAKTFMHTGYTGTMVCADPVFPTGPLVTVLLTNRVYPTDATGSTKIHAVRQAFGDAVATTLLQKHSEPEPIFAVA